MYLVTTRIRGKYKAIQYNELLSSSLKSKIGNLKR